MTRGARLSHYGSIYKKAGIFLIINWSFHFELSNFKTISELISKKVHHWIGNRRRPDCPGFYFHSDPNHQCGHNKIHEWLNNVATEDIPIELWGFKQPDHAWKPQGRQECGSIAYGMPGSNGEPKLDDGRLVATLLFIYTCISFSCEVKMPFICTAKGVLKATTASRLWTFLPI